MNVQDATPEDRNISGLYQELEHWHVNTGGKTIHAKRMPGRFRTLKYITESFWLIFFLGAYLRWNGKQAVILDVPGRQFHFFNLTILPQDIWMLSLVLLLMAMTLFAATSVASRMFCGYFCFQTAWTDLFTWVEEKIEGAPQKRHKLDSAPWNLDKIRIKLVKHVIWLLISVLTGISFSIWFVDAFDYWHNLLTFHLPMIGWVTLMLFTAGTYILAGLMREQACFWLCPYARIQGVMGDTQTILPTYDNNRGEPRGKLQKDRAASEKKQGDCIDCFQCVQVCPTGVDIREGQQLGCITCGMCIDACDSVMTKINRPVGLIRYASLDELEGRPVKKIYQHPRTLVYVGIIAIALSGIVYGLTHLGSLELKVIPERQPLFVRESDGSIQNKFTFKVLNKTDKDIYVAVTANEGVTGQKIIGAEEPIKVVHERATNFTIFVRASDANVTQEVMPLEFRVSNIDDAKIFAQYATKFNGPKR